MSRPPRLRLFKTDRAIWTCSICGRVDHWGPDWSWFGSLSDKKTGHEPNVMAVLCSGACQAKHAHGKQAGA